MIAKTSRGAGGDGKSVGNASRPPSEGAKPAALLTGVFGFFPDHLSLLLPVTCPGISGKVGFLTGSLKPAGVGDLVVAPRDP